MDVMTITSLVQLVVAVALIVSILLQQRSSGLGMSFGGGGGMDGSYYTRRGFEKFLTQATIGLAIAFVILSIAQMFV